MFGENYWNQYVVTGFAGVIVVFYFLFGFWKRKSSAEGKSEEETQSKTSNSFDERSDSDEERLLKEELASVRKNKEIHLKKARKQQLKMEIEKEKAEIEMCKKDLAGFTKDTMVTKKKVNEKSDKHYETDTGEEPKSEEETKSNTSNSSDESSDSDEERLLKDEFATVRKNKEIHLKKARKQRLKMETEKENSDVNKKKVNEKSDKHDETDTGEASGGIPDINNPSLMPRTEQTISAEAKLKRWRNQKINLAVIGRSNTGKSTFINLIRDVSEGEPDYATTGSGNTTMDVYQYEHPKSKQLVLWDVPGVGTAIVTKEKFMKKVKLSMFDFCFIFLDSVFSEDDIWLAKTLKSLKIPFCFIRSKIDIGIEKSSDPKTIVAKVREKLLEEKRMLPDIEDSKLFLISNLRKHFHLGDLPKLFDYITSILPGEKVEVLLFFLPMLSPEMIEKKYYAFKNRIEIASSLAGVISANPIPFIDIPANLALITNEIRLYIQGFGLDKDYVKHVRGVKQRSATSALIASAASSGCRFATLLGVAACSQIDSMIPILGTAAAATSTKLIVQKYLLSTLDELKKDAELVYEFYTYGE